MAYGALQSNHKLSAMLQLDVILSLLYLSSSSLICVATNLYWFLHKDIDPRLFLKINIPTALLLTLVVLLQTIQQGLKK